MVKDVRVLGAKKFQAKLQKISVFTRNQYATRIIKELHKWTLGIMPRDTGALKAALTYVARKKTASLNQRMPAQARQNPRPYHLWLNSTGNRTYLKSDGTTGTIDLGKFQARIVTGKVNYMQKASEEMRDRIAAEEFSDEFKKIFK